MQGLLSKLNELERKASVSIKPLATALESETKGEDEMPIKEAAPADMSYDDIRRRLSAALKIKMGIGQGIDGPWVRDVFDDHLIYEMGEKAFRLDYTMDANGVVTTAEPIEVVAKTVYDPVVAEAGGDIIQGDFIALEEKAVGKNGVAEIKIIEPGWGSSGYYSKEMLKRDAPVYAPGTHMYWDHPTESEERERPERSLRDLAGQLTSAGTYKEDGPRGPGVYAQAKVFGPYQSALEELAPNIGVSHRAWGEGSDGEAEGKTGKIIERIVKASSVDYVTTPGAGGKVVQMFESARPKVQDADKDNIETPEKQITEEETHMDEEKIKMLEEAKDQLEADKVKLEEENTQLKEEKARLAEAQVLRDAHDLAAEKVGASDLPEITKKRLTETLAAKPILIEGGLDIVEYTKVIEEAIKAEMVYVAELTKSGTIRGMGSSDTDVKGLLKETFKAGFLADGYSDDVAEKMAETAARGR